jgi:ketosteroid isomerase-like protein
MARSFLPNSIRSGRRAIKGVEAIYMTQRSDHNPDRKPFGPEEREIMALQHAWMKAVMAHDAAALQHILAEDFTLTSVHSSGELLSKAQYIGSFGKVKNSLFSFRDVVIRIYGEMAVVNSRFHQQYSGDSKESAGEFLLTDVWVKRAGRWQAVSRHASRPALTIERASAFISQEAE